MDVVPDHVEQFARAVASESDPLVEEMDAHAEETGFPTVGPAVGGWLRLLAGAVDARRVFEFGSGFGYSAYWFAGALPDDGEVVCTEYDADNVARADRYLERGGVRDRVTLERGDALEVVESYDGPFDVVLVDNEKERYREAFEAVRGKVAPGGLVCADNAMVSANVEFDALLALVEGRDVETTAPTRGIAGYLRAVRDDEAFETALLPVGEGLAVSRKRA